MPKANAVLPGSLSLCSSWPALRSFPLHPLLCVTTHCRPGVSFCRRRGEHCLSNTPFPRVCRKCRQMLSSLPQLGTSRLWRGLFPNRWPGFGLPLALLPRGSGLKTANTEMRMTCIANSTCCLQRKATSLARSFPETQTRDQTRKQQPRVLLCAQAATQGGATGGAGGGSTSFNGRCSGKLCSPWDECPPLIITLYWWHRQAAATEALPLASSDGRKAVVNEISTSSSRACRVSMSSVHPWQAQQS